jgi:aryl-alcohol dehydrogenase-like predicted oxidoreductase
MQYVNLGKTGMKVSRLCLGMMTYGSKKSREWFIDLIPSLDILKI